MINNNEVVADLLIQLGNALKGNKTEYINGSVDENKNNKTFLTRKEVLEVYAPVITAYGLSQAINMDGFPYIKRGKKYFFVKEDIDKWLSERNGTTPVKRIINKYV